MHTHKFLDSGLVFFHHGRFDGGGGGTAVAFTSTGAQGEQHQDQQGRDQCFVFHNKYVWIKTAYFAGYYAKIIM